MYLARLNRMIELLEGLTPLMRLDVAYDLNKLARSYRQRSSNSNYEVKCPICDNSDLVQTAAAASLIDVMANLVAPVPVEEEKAA